MIWTKTDPAWHVCGISAILYSDHGSDFTMPATLEQVCADLHVQLTHSTAGVPQGRGKIDRFFGSVDELFLPGQLVRGRPASPLKLTLAGLDTALHTFIVTGLQPATAQRNPPGAAVPLGRGRVPATRTGAARGPRRRSRREQPTQRRPADQGEAAAGLAEAAVV